MNKKRFLSLVIAVLFILAVSFSYKLDLARANEDDGDIVVGGMVNGSGSKGENGKGSEDDSLRTANMYQHDTSTSPYGETFQKWSFAPDIGYGEVGEGYSYMNPLTGASISYQVTGMGMGTIPLPIYGGMGSQYGLASYGIFANGNIPIVQSTPGVQTQTSTSGNAYGEGYQYAASQPDPTAMMAMSLMQNPSTAGLGYAMAFSAGGFGGFSLPTTIGGTSGLGSIGALGSLGSISGLGVLGGLGIPSGIGGYGSYQVPGIGYGIGGAYGAYSSGLTAAAPAYYNNAYAPASYGASYALSSPSYGSGYVTAPSYGGGYVAAPVSTGYVPSYGY